MIVDTLGAFGAVRAPPHAIAHATNRLNTKRLMVAWCESAVRLSDVKLVSVARARHVATPRKQVAVHVSVLQACLLRETLHRLLLFRAELLGQCDVRLHIHVAAPAVPFDAVPRDAEFLAMLRSRRNP